MTELFFQKRLSEPSFMTDKEEESFNIFMEQNYERIFTPFINYIDEYIIDNKVNVIVELGCGNGLLCSGIAKKANKSVKIIGIDRSYKMLKAAKIRCVKNKNIVFNKSDASKLSLNSDSVDLVICKDSFHEFSQSKQVVKEVHRVMKKDAHIIIYDLRRDMPWKYFKICLDRDNIFKKIQYYSVRASYTKDEIKKLLESNNFKNIKVKTPKVSEIVKKKNKKINSETLKISFQTRYLAIAKK